MDDAVNWQEVLIKAAQQDGDLPEDRAHVLKGLHAMQQGDLKAAMTLFRRGQRKDQGDFSWIASVALGECLRLENKEGAALKAWRLVAYDQSAPVSARYGALLGMAKLLEARDGEDAELAKVQSLLAELDLQVSVI